MSRPWLALIVAWGALSCSSPTKNSPAPEEASADCGSQVFCDDFESSNVNGAPDAPWTRNLEGAASVFVTNERAASGTHSVRIDAPSKAAAFLELAGPPFFPVANDSFFGRARFFFESVPASEVHWTFLAGSGLRADDQHRAEYRYGGQKPLLDSSGAFLGSQLMANYETPDFYSGGGPGSDCWHHSQARPVPVGRWVCVEWQFDGPNDAMRLWLDGEAAEDLTVNATGQGCVHQPAGYTWTAPSFERVSLGWQGYQPDERRTVYVDDVALGTSRIGCDG